jgi:serine/threonine protein kinase
MAHPKTFIGEHGKYTRCETLGEGGSGYVLKVITETGEERALKYLRAGSASADRERRFRNEIRICRETGHPNIVKVSDVGIIEGNLKFYVMRLYDTTLREMFQRTDVSIAQRLAILVRVIEGVCAAHDLGVAHRDLKPENILLSQDAHEVVVADFGIAAFIEANMETVVETKPGERLANFRYCAPEQLRRGEHGDKRADVFALGAMLNEAVTVRVPRGESYVTMESKHSELRYLDQVVKSMMSHDPEDRPSLTSLQAAIALVLDKIGPDKHDNWRASLDVAAEADKNPLVRSPPELSLIDWSAGRASFSLSTPIMRDWRLVFAGKGYVPEPPLLQEESPRNVRWLSPSMFSVEVSEARVDYLVRAYRLHVEMVNVGFKLATKKAITDGAYPWDGGEL